MESRGARVVTPEAVVLDVQTAGLGSRVFAKAIDFLVQGATLVLLLAIIVAVGVDSVAVTLVLVTVGVLGYPIILESLWRGRTVGKAALGLRVVTREGAPIRFRHALIRGLFGLLEVLGLPVIGVLAMLGSRSDQRLGDMAAGTIVLRERAASQASWPAVFSPPPGLESYVATLDVTAMTAGEYETVRSFLLRAHEMDPRPRAELAARLAGPLVLRWHQPVPDGVGPETWLACAASAYQQRTRGQGGGFGGYWAFGVYGGSGPYGAPGPYGSPVPYGATGPYGPPGASATGPYGSPVPYGFPAPYGPPDPYLAAGGWGPPPPGTRMDGPAPVGANGYLPPSAGLPPTPGGRMGVQPTPPPLVAPGPVSIPSAPPGQAQGTALPVPGSSPSALPVRRPAPPPDSLPEDGGFAPPA